MSTFLHCAGQQKIVREADAIHREMQVERLHILEHMLLKFVGWDIMVVSGKRRKFGVV